METEPEQAVFIWHQTVYAWTGDDTYIFLFCEDGTICAIGTGRFRVEVGETMAFLPSNIFCPLLGL